MHLDISQNHSLRSIAKEVMIKSDNNLEVSYFSLFFDFTSGSSHLNSAMAKTSGKFSS